MRCLTGFAIYMWPLVVSQSSNYWLGISPRVTLIALVEVEVCLGIRSCGTRWVPRGSRGLILGSTGRGRPLLYPASVSQTKLSITETFMFNDNTTAESAYHNVTSSSPELLNWLLDWVNCSCIMVWSCILFTWQVHALLKMHRWFITRKYIERDSEWCQDAQVFAHTRDWIISGTFAYLLDLYLDILPWVGTTYWKGMIMVVTGTGRSELY